MKKVISTKPEKIEGYVCSACFSRDTVGLTTCDEPDFGPVILWCACGHIKILIAGQTVTVVSREE